MRVPLLLIAVLMASCASVRERWPRLLTMAEVQEAGLDAGYRWSEHLEVDSVAGFYSSRTGGANRFVLYPTGVMVGCSGHCAGEWHLEGNLLFITTSRTSWHSKGGPTPWNGSPYYVLSPLPPHRATGERSAPDGDAPRPIRRANVLYPASELRRYLGGDRRPPLWDVPSVMSGTTHAYRR